MSSKSSPSAFLSALEKLVSRVNRTVIGCESRLPVEPEANRPSATMVVAEVQVPFRPQFLVVESKGFMLVDAKAGNQSFLLSYGADISLDLFTIEALDEWIEKGEIPGRCRFDGSVVTVGEHLSLVVRNTNPEPKIFRAVMIGDLLTKRHGWKGSLRGTLAAIGADTRASFVEVLMGNDVVRVPVEDAEVQSLSESLGRGVKVTVEVEPDYMPKRELQERKSEEQTPPGEMRNDLASMLNTHTEQTADEAWQLYLDLPGSDCSPEAMRATLCLKPEASTWEVREAFFSAWRGPK